MYTVMVIDHRNDVNESFANSQPMATVGAARAAMTRSFNGFTRAGTIYKTKGKDCAMAFEPDGWVAWFVADDGEPANELGGYTTDELYDELRGRDDVFSVQLWVREDVERCFPRKGDDEIDEFMDLNSSRFDDRCTELGWEVMEALDY